MWQDYYQWPHLYITTFTMAIKITFFLNLTLTTIFSYLINKTFMFVPNQNE